VKRPGAEIFVDALVAEGAEVMFGYPGGQVIALFDALYERSDIRLILVRHEQAAAHAADGYARATGKVGVCVATSGPGATNLTTGIATANFDSVPMVAITGQVPTHLIGNDAFQEADTTGITRPITKYNTLLEDPSRIRQTVKEAFYIARTGRPGPVVIDLPGDVQKAQVEDDGDAEIDLPGYKPNVEGNARQVRLAAEAVNASKRPVLYVGGGVIISGAAPELRELAEKAHIPVTMTLLGLGAFPGDHELSLRMLGMHGTGYANHAVQQADVLVAVGARFDDRVTGKLNAFAPRVERIIHIDIDPASISKNIPVHIPIQGDAKNILGQLNALVRPAKHEDWLKQIAEWKARFPLTYDRQSDQLKPQYVVEQVYEATKGEAIITTEVGQNQMWAAQYYTFKRPRQFLSSGGLGTMGYGFPAAIGAQVGCPDAVVFDIAGDGSIQMNIQELATAVANRLPVKVAILNNGYLGMVRQWQELFFRKRYSHTRLVGNPNFVKVAEAYGATGILVERKEEVRGAIERALATPGPVFLDFHVNPEENVFPMVPAGEAIDQMISGMA
jgi:acetolactate synthase-1/2/3 large subunit